MERLRQHKMEIRRNYRVRGTPVTPAQRREYIPRCAASHHLPSRNQYLSSWRGPPPPALPRRNSLLGPRARLQGHYQTTRHLHREHMNAGDPSRIVSIRCARIGPTDGFCPCDLRGSPYPVYPCADWLARIGGEFQFRGSFRGTLTISKSPGCFIFRQCSGNTTPDNNGFPHRFQNNCVQFSDATRASPGNVASVEEVWHAQSKDIVLCSTHSTTKTTTCETCSGLCLTSSQPLNGKRCLGRYLAVSLSVGVQRNRGYPFVASRHGWNGGCGSCGLRFGVKSLRPRRCDVDRVKAVE